MDPAVEEHLIYQLANAPLRLYPFPHLYIESIFPPEYYAQLREHWPQASQLVSLESTGRVPQGWYAERFIMPLTSEKVGELPEDGTREFWKGFGKKMLGSPRFMYAAMDKFEPQLRQRFGAQLETLDFTHEILIVRDHSNYRLGPHTDSPHKVLSFLFYCPDDDVYSHLGTSIYTPIDPTFRCPGGPHHPFKGFHKVKTMEYRANTLFAFVKTDNSFHGVYPIRDADVLRDLILYDIQVTTPVTDRRES